MAKSKTTTPKTTGAKSTKKSEEPKVDVASVAATPVVSTPVVSAQATAPVATPAPEVSADDGVLLQQTNDFMSKLQGVAQQFSQLRTEFRSLEKQWTRSLKTAHKANSKRKRKTGNRSPSGFVKPTLISSELAAFLGKENGSEMARTEVTREINKYIRANDLQDKENGRKINPDAKLTKLLKLTKTDELTYFNLQRYMSPHFAKAGAKEFDGKVLDPT